MPVRRRCLAMVSVADAPYVEVSCHITFQFASTQSLLVITKTRSPYEGWRFLSSALYLPLRCRPLRTMRPPPPAVATESQWGERRRGAFGTYARIAGS